MADSPLTLHVDASYASPYAMSAFVGLVEKGVAFDLATVDLDRGDQRGGWHAATSITRRVPTLVQGDFRLSESSAITEYLDETLGGTALYPAEPRARALARQVQAWLRSDLMPISEERTTSVIFLAGGCAPLSAAARAAADHLFAAAGALAAHGGERLFGRWCIADTDLALMLDRPVVGGDAVPGPLAAHASSQWRRPSVQRRVALPRPLR
jgi:glutathione S-transferase